MDERLTALKAESDKVRAKMDELYSASHDCLLTPEYDALFWKWIGLSEEIIAVVREERDNVLDILSH